MCGIFAYIGPRPYETNLFSFYLIKHRGPDNSQYKQIVEDQITFGFHRLSINDLTPNGNQPLEHDGITLICNGEIYNHKALAQVFQIQTQSNSDCEIIIHLYQKIGIFQALQQLDGVFAFVLHDSKRNLTIAARDPVGIRPLFIGISPTDNSYYLSSEAKSIEKHCSIVEQFKPGHYWVTSNKEFIPFWTIDNPCIVFDTSHPLKRINQLLKAAVFKRINNSERPIGFFLSGGFDSSIVAAIAQKMSPQTQYHTFSIGFYDSPDLKYASQVAKFIGSKHHEITFTLHEALNIIPEVIYSLESYDITTVRASVPMWLLARYISKQTPIKVVLSGEGSDEYGSYVYFKDAPTPHAFEEESRRLLTEIHFYDVLRADRCTAAHGLEVRVPFLDLDLLKFLTNINTKYRMSHNNIEKYYLRKAFEDDELLPPDVLWRKKEAFSDSVGNSWRRAIITHVSSLYTDKDLVVAQKKYTYLPPMTKEALWYRDIFEQHFSKSSTSLIPHYWMPKWQPKNITDPSATILKAYKE